MGTRYLNHLLIWLTQGLNVLLGGYPDESTSSRTHRQQHKRRWRIARRVINGIWFWQEDHCREAFEAERQRLQHHPALRDIHYHMNTPRP